MNRRSFFVICLSCLIGSFGAVFWRFGHRQHLDVAPTGPAARLRRHFWYLKIDRQDLESFVDDYQQHFFPINEENFTLVAMCFLMSTDFFPQGADELLPVKYTGLYDPETGSANPFARFPSAS